MKRRQYRYNERREDPNNLILINDFARIQEVSGLEVNNEPMLRFYRVSPDGFNLQIRTYAPTTPSGVGKPRNMIADISLGIPELELLLAYAREQMPNHTAEGGAR